MASTQTNTYFARPLYIAKEDRPPSYEKRGGTSGRVEGNTSKPSTGQNQSKHVRISEMESSEPPPRPPPPRPLRIPKQPVEKPTQGRVPNHGPSLHEKPTREQAWPEKRIESKRSHQNQTTPESKPLTRTNVTSHEQLWQKDAERHHTDVLLPPLEFITPQLTEEMVRNYDPLDVIDSLSDHSDSSADTMIMMTTEEEQKNQEKIDHSLKEYKSVKSKPDIPYTNQTKMNLQSNKDLHLHLTRTNGIVGGQATMSNGVMSSAEQQHLSKVTLLHIKTDNDSNGSSPESVSNKNRGSPNADSPDDGYGTNSSSGTVSSPFSSSFNSVLTDLDSSCNGHGKRGPVLPNGAIKPNSVRENWVVKRKQRMIESEDHSVQDQLRTIFEEDGTGNTPENLRLAQQRMAKPHDKGSHGVNVSGKGQNVTAHVNRGEANQQTSRKEVPFVNVSQNDLARRSRQLFVRDSENDNSQVSVAKPDEKNGHQMPMQNEINRALRVSTHERPTQRGRSDIGAENVHNSGNRGAQANTHNSGNRGAQANGHNLGNRVAQANGRSQTLPAYGRNQDVPPLRDFVDGGDPNYMDDERQFSSLPDNFERTPPLLRGGSENRHRSSGKIYVSPTGDEGFYSLNRSSRSTSMSSVLPPPSEGSDNVWLDNEKTSSPRSPLEVLSGDLLEKWSDMDRNYRNYYGFDEQTEKYSRTDSKVNYFQEKKINNAYGHDNYYRPANYGQETAQGHVQVKGQGLANQGIPRDSKDNENTHTEQVTRSSRSSSGKSHKEQGSRSKFFQILPNMFKPSSKKDSNTEHKSNVKDKHKGLRAVTVEPSVVQKHRSLDLEAEAEYMNVGDLPQYSMANIEMEEKLKKGQFVSVDNLHKRPVFASSKDINKLFSMHDQSFDSIHHPGSQRHSFHAMPHSYRHMNIDPGSSEDMRPRAQSTSGATRNQQVRNSVESRMAMISRKNAAVMNEARQASNLTKGSQGAHSTSSQRHSSGSGSGSRSRLDSGSSGGDSKLSTLV